MQKTKVLDAVKTELLAEFERFQLASVTTRGGGTDAEGRAEDKYDTRSTEANYLADGQARLADAARESLAAFEALEPGKTHSTAQLGSLVQVQFGTESNWFLLGPAAGGVTVKIGRTEVTVITPESPLGSQLIGLKKGGAIHRPVAKVLSIG